MMKRLCTFLMIFSFIVMSTAYAMDVHTDVDSGDVLQIVTSIDASSNNNDTSNDDVQCQIHCSHTGAHAMFSGSNPFLINALSAQTPFSSTRVPGSQGHEPPFYPPIT